MQSAELKIGRTFGVVFEHGKDFFAELEEFCRTNGVRQGYIPMFIAAFKEAEIAGACDRLEDPDAPVWSKVYVENIEVIGAGTLTYDEAQGRLEPHIHVSLGEKPRSAQALTSHLFSGKIQFLAEMMIIEVLEPKMERVTNPSLYNIALMTFR
jgi:predicted DNA-binding protein with PD1-like motif